MFFLLLLLRCQDACVKKLYELYPKVQGKIDYFEVSTPATIEHYLRATDGGAVGLDQTPKRFTDVGVQDLLDTQTKVFVDCFYMFCPRRLPYLCSSLRVVFSSFFCVCLCVCVCVCVCVFFTQLCEYLQRRHRSLGYGKLGKTP